MTTDRVTACLIIHNEEKVLARCLQSLTKITSTILVVHDGECTDNSLQIARTFGCHVFIRPFIGEAEPHRPWLFGKVTTPYCLQIDADEYLSEELVSHIPRLLDQNADGYTAIWPYWDGKKYQTATWPRKLFLYKMTAISLLGVPHESVRVQGTVLDTPYVLEHKPTYDNLRWNTFRTKWTAWARIHAAYYLQDSSALQRFHDPEQLLQIHYSTWMNFAPWSAPFLALYHTTASLVLGGLSQGSIGVKSSLFMGMYYGMVCYNVGKLRYAKIL